MVFVLCVPVTLATFSVLFFQQFWQRFLYCCASGFGDCFCVVGPVSFVTVSVLLYQQLL